MQREFLELYPDVIDENNTIKQCGRDLCKDLIALADALEPGISHGNRANGVVNAKTMVTLKNKLETE